MNVSHYYCKTPENGEMRLAFSRYHAAEIEERKASTSDRDKFRPLTHLDALRLVNKWNRIGGDTVKYYI